MRLFGGAESTGLMYIIDVSNRHDASGLFENSINSYEQVTKRDDVGNFSDQKSLPRDADIAILSTNRKFVQLDLLAS